MVYLVAADVPLPVPGLQVLRFSSAPLANAFRSYAPFATSPVIPAPEQLASAPGFDSAFLSRIREEALLGFPLARRLWGVPSIARGIQPRCAAAAVG